MIPLELSLSNKLRENKGVFYREEKKAQTGGNNSD